MIPYRIFIDLTVINRLRSLRLKHRKPILDFIESLKIEPDQSGDFVEFDETGREIQGKIIGDYALYFWNDSPVREVKVVRIGAADTDD